MEVASMRGILLQGVPGQVDLLHFALPPQGFHCLAVQRKDHALCISSKNIEGRVGLVRFHRVGTEHGENVQGRHGLRCSYWKCTGRDPYAERPDNETLGAGGRSEEGPPDLGHPEAEYLSLRTLPFLNGSWNCCDRLRPLRQSAAKQRKAVCQYRWKKRSKFLRHSAMIPIKPRVPRPSKHSKTGTLPS